MKSKNVIKLLLTGALLLVVTLGWFLVLKTNEVNALAAQLSDQQKYIDYIQDGNLDSEYVTITVIEADGTQRELKSYVELDMSIMTVMLFNGYKQEEFASYDTENFYFATTLTDVLELKDNPDYYMTDQYGSFLYVGLNKIKADKDYTVVSTNWQ